MRAHLFQELLPEVTNQAVVEVISRAELSLAASELACPLPAPLPPLLLTISCHLSNSSWWWSQVHIVQISFWGGKGGGWISLVTLTCIWAQVFMLSFCMVSTFKSHSLFSSSLTVHCNVKHGDQDLQTAVSFRSEKELPLPRSWPCCCCCSCCRPCSWPAPSPSPPASPTPTRWRTPPSGSALGSSRRWTGRTWWGGTGCSCRGGGRDNWTMGPPTVCRLDPRVTSPTLSTTVSSPTGEAAIHPIQEKESKLQDLLLWADMNQGRWYGERIWFEVEWERIINGHDRNH